MKIQILLKSIATSIRDNKKGVIKINMDNCLRITSCEQLSLGGLLNFMENNIIQIDAALPSFITFQLFIGEFPRAKTSLFLAQAIDKKQITLNSMRENDTNFYNLNYEIKITEVKKTLDGGNQLVPLKLKRKTTMKEDINQTVAGEKNRVKMLELGTITYSFAKRLDPLVYIANQAKQIIFWKKPQITVGFGIILSLMVLFPKISLILMSICLIFGRNYLINQFERSLIKQDISKRILPPDQNLNFLKQLMQIYYDTFESIYGFLKEDDRTKIITLVQLATKFGVIVLVLSLIFSLETLIIIGIWSVLIMTSSTGKRLRKILWPTLLDMNTKVDDVLQNVTKSSVGRVLKSNSSQNAIFIKQYYSYEYQRWWVGKQWVPSHYSDENNKIVMQPRKDPPIGWEWLGKWEPIKNMKNTDMEGYEYANDLMPHAFNENKTFKAIRRRKWIRLCQKISPDQSPKTPRIYSSDLTHNKAQPPSPTPNELHLGKIKTQYKRQ